MSSGCQIVRKFLRTAKEPALVWTQITIILVCFGRGFFLFLLFCNLSQTTPWANGTLITAEDTAPQLTPLVIQMLWNLDIPSNGSASSSISSLVGLTISPISIIKNFFNSFVSSCRFSFIIVLWPHHKHYQHQCSFFSFLFWMPSSARNFSSLEVMKSLIEKEIGLLQRHYNWFNKFYRHWYINY